jgi:predicted dehydrogenase
MKEQLTRRNFIKRSSIAGVGVALGTSAMTAKSYGNIIGSNDRLNFAVIGVRSRGAAHIDSISVCENAVVTHVCDVDSRYLEKSVAQVQKNSGQKPKSEKDIRKLLEVKDIDAISIATPEHWHAPMAIMALQAGKNVYLEKPSSHNPAEGEMLLNAQKKYKSLIQMGNQQRSSAHTKEAMTKIHSGVIGRAYMGKAWYSNNRESIGVGRQVPVPDYLDWELWQGPAPRKTYKDNVHPYNWHWFWHWGTGETLNNATHEFDLCLWALQVKFPRQISAVGGRYHYQDDWEFYDTLMASFEYENGMISWEGKSCNKMNTYGRGRGATIHGTEGTVLIDRNGYEIYNNNAEKIFEFVKPQQDETTGLQGGGPMTDAHFQNFIDAIRRGEKLDSPIHEGQIAVTSLLLSNIAWKTGKTLEIDPSNGHILNDRLAMDLLWGREYEPGWEPVV